jgi:TonB family protein
MRCVSRRLCILGVCFFLFCAASVCRAQSPGIAGEPERKVSLTTLSLLAYPPIARVAHIAGNLVLRLEITKDGTVLSAIVESGPALQALRESALDSAKHSQFECHDCSEAPTIFYMTYSFQLQFPADPCADITSERLGQNGLKPYPHVDYSGLHVTVTDLASAICDPAATTRARSIKCLYLWKCTSH